MSIGAERLAVDVLDGLLEGCQVIGPDWRYLYVNDAAAAQGGRPRAELVGKTMMECYPGIEQTPMFEVLRRCMTERARDRMENEFTFPDGGKGWFELRFMPVPEGVCILSMDITGPKRAAAALLRTEAQLRHAQKMEAVGRLAGGVAHDFNNLLSVVLANTELILADLPAADPLRADLEQIDAAGKRGAELTRQLLAFSRQQVLEPRVIDLNQILGSIERMLQRLLGADIELTMLPASRLGRVTADPGQIEQAIMNLAVNARDAMPSGGKLTIETVNVTLDDGYVDAHFGVRPGSYVMLAVSDTGVGMDAETRARIFEPFFTTKEKGKGTGLGLSTVFGTVQQCGGHIWVYSEPGAGTTFKLYFPRVDGAAEPAQTTSLAPPESRGNETILLVEDDDAVRTVTRNILRRAGYHVLDASNGGEAFLICEKQPGKIHLLLTDVVLPHMSGRELVARVAPLRPQMRVLFMSGYTGEAIIQHGVIDSDFPFLQKPITPGSLARRVREVLDSVSRLP